MRRGGTNADGCRGISAPVRVEVPVCQGSPIARTQSASDSEAFNIPFALILRLRTLRALRSQETASGMILNQMHSEAAQLDLPFALSVVASATESKCRQRFDSALAGYAQRERGIGGSLYTAQERRIAHKRQPANNRFFTSPCLASGAAWWAQDERIVACATDSKRCRHFDSVALDAPVPHCLIIDIPSASVYRTTMVSPIWTLPKRRTSGPTLNMLTLPCGPRMATSRLA